jgi:hypothetical protein
VILAVAGAALGSILQVDSAKSAVENQIRPAIRRQFERATRLSVLVQRIDDYSFAVRQSTPGTGESEPSRVADRLDDIAFHLRDEINSTASAIEDWGDLARNVSAQELERYQNRDQRSPNGSNSGGST